MKHSPEIWNLSVGRLLPKWLPHYPGDGEFEPQHLEKIYIYIYIDVLCFFFFSSLITLHLKTAAATPPPLVRTPNYNVLVQIQRILNISIPPSVETAYHRITLSLRRAFLAFVKEPYLLPPKSCLFHRSSCPANTHIRLTLS